MAGQVCRGNRHGAVLAAGHSRVGLPLRAALKSSQRCGAQICTQIVQCELHREVQAQVRGPLRCECDLGIDNIACTVSILHGIEPEGEVLVGAALVGPAGEGAGEILHADPAAFIGSLLVVHDVAALGFLQCPLAVVGEVLLQEQRLGVAVAVVFIRGQILAVVRKGVIGGAALLIGLDREDQSAIPGVHRLAAVLAVHQCRGDHAHVSGGIIAALGADDSLGVVIVDHIRAIRGQVTGLRAGANVAAGVRNARCVVEIEDIDIAHGLHGVHAEALAGVVLQIGVGAVIFDAGVFDRIAAVDRLNDPLAAGVLFFVQRQFFPAVLAKILGAQLDGVFAAGDVLDGIHAGAGALAVGKGDLAVLHRHRYGTSRAAAGIAHDAAGRGGVNKVAAVRDVTGDHGGFLDLAFGDGDEPNGEHPLAAGTDFAVGREIVLLRIPLNIRTSAHVLDVVQSVSGILYRPGVVDAVQRHTGKAGTHTQLFVFALAGQGEGAVSIVGKGPDLAGLNFVKDILGVQGHVNALIIVPGVVSGQSLTVAGNIEHIIAVGNGGLCGRRIGILIFFRSECSELVELERIDARIVTVHTIAGEISAKVLQILRLFSILGIGALDVPTVCGLLQVKQRIPPLFFHQTDVCTIQI